MKVLILEDEIPAQMQIKRLLYQNYPDFDIMATLTSVLSAAEWLKKNTVDIIFMDVELSDGICFELFNLVDVKSNIIVTTAYESYALSAFKVNSIDYLLKPVEKDEFIKAVEKCKKLRANTEYSPDFVNKLISASKVYKQRFTVKLGTQIIVVNTTDIAYFYADNKATYIVSFDKKMHLSDLTLDTIESQINPEIFFKLSRSCIASISAIESISRHFNSRLKVHLKPQFKEDIFVSRVRVPAFLEWLEGVH